MAADRGADSARASRFSGERIFPATTATAGPVSSGCCAAWWMPGRRAATRCWSRRAAWWRRSSTTRTLPAARASLSMEIVDKMVTSALEKFDRHHGGFGAQPKFAHPSAIDLLLDVAGRTGNEAAREAATVTLEKMAQGGVYDQLGGGFHRYSVDERWVVPHFEKMLYDNAELLKNYVHAFQSYVDPEFGAGGARHYPLDGRVADGPRAGRLLRFAGCGYRPGRRWRLLYLDAGRSCGCADSGGDGDCRGLLRHRRPGGYASQSREERAACEADARCGGGSCG